MAQHQSQVSVNGKPAIFILDIGATRTYQYPSIMKVIPEFTEIGRRQYERITGVSGDTVQDSIALTSVQLSLGRIVLLTRRKVLLNVGQGNSSGVGGILGTNLV